MPLISTLLPSRFSLSLILTCSIAVTKNGINRLAQPSAIDVSKYKTDKKITDEEILKILEQPIGKTS